jgi:hypothetical protein
MIEKYRIHVADIEPVFERGGEAEIEPTTALKVYAPNRDSCFKD